MYSPPFIQKGGRWIKDMAHEKFALIALLAASALAPPAMSLHNEERAGKQRAGRQSCIS